MRTPKLEVITCPRCGAEYLPAEIYYPDKFLGQPKNIMKDENGKLGLFNGKSVDMAETFECEYCNAPLKVFGKATFRAEIDEKKDFSEDYTSKVYPQQVTLFEDE